MDKGVRVLFWFIVIFPLLGPGLIFSQDKQDPLKEAVEVKNVELIVRVLLKGKPLAGLIMNEFTLLENDKKMKITSCTEVKRKIGKKQAMAPVTENNRIQPRKKRLFLIYFWVTERNPNYRDALDYFFKDVFRNGDTVVMVVKNKVFQVIKKEEIAPSLAWLDKQILMRAQASRSDNILIIRTVENLFNQYINELHTRQPDEMKLRALRLQIDHQLDSSLRTHKFKHLIANNKQLHHLAEELKKLQMDKWGIVFFQNPAFPQINIQKLDHQLDRMDWEVETLKLRKIMYGFKLKTSKPNVTLTHLKNIKQAFVNGETTFHLLSLESNNDYLHETENMEIGTVFSGWREAFKGITKATGGMVVSNNNLKESLGKIVEREDIFYRLTYAPQAGPKEKRKIEVKVNRKGVTVTHLQQVIVESGKQL